jgi:histidyl-tRNA synthetase
MEEKKLLEAQRPGGFQDFFGGKYLAREKMLEIIRKTFVSFGFDGVETPIIEFRKILSEEEGETGKQIFSITNRDSSGEDLALRFDHTVPFARILAQYPYDANTRNGIRLPWRRMAIGPVFRGERPQNGRYRQFYQCDADIAGTDAMIADAEIVNVIYATLVALGVERFVIRINNRKILNGMGSFAQISGGEKTAVDGQTIEIMRVLDKIDKIGIDGVTEILQNEPLALNSETIEKMRTFLSLNGTNHEKLDHCAALFENIESVQEGITELREILSLLHACEIPDQYVQIDFSIARGLDYYTGPVMETVLLDAPEYGSVFSGGRYNGLVSRFTGQDVPAVGASIGVDRLFAALCALSIITNKEKTACDVMILQIMPGRYDFYLALAHKIRATGRNTEISLLKDTTFTQQFNYALNRGVRYVVICGENEHARDVVQIKDLQNREQVEVESSDISTFFTSKK